MPGDLSSGAFFLCAAALFPGSHLILDQVLMNPTRARLLDWLTVLGLRISVMQLEEKNGELVGTIEVRGDQLKGGTIAGANTAALIDEIPVLAAIAPYTQNGIEVRDAKELRVKESDRIAAISAGLRAMGANVEEREDGFSVGGGQSLHGAEVDSMGDHRIAMAFGIAALRASGRNADPQLRCERSFVSRLLRALEGVARTIIRLGDPPIFNRLSNSPVDVPRVSHKSLLDVKVSPRFGTGSAGLPPSAKFHR